MTFTLPATSQMAWPAASQGQIWAVWPDGDALGIGHAQPYDDIQLPGIDDLAHRGSDRQGLAKLAGEAVQDAGNRRGS